MPRRPFGQRDPTVRADALKRHALVRRIERRERWLEKGGVTPQLLAEALQTLKAGMQATKLIPAVVDKRGTVLERVEVPDHSVRVKAAAEVADFVRLVSGLTAEPKAADGKAQQIAVVVSIPAWLQAQQPALPEAARPADAETVAVTKISDEEEVVNHS